MENYLFFYLKTGGGHLAPAKAVANYFRENYSGTNVILIDGLTESKSIAKRIIEDGYAILQSKAKWYYEFLYATNKFLPIGFFNILMTNYFVKDYLKKTILEHKPSKIIIFHFFLINPIYKILKELNLDIPILTVVTDPFTAHPLWFQNKKQKYIVFSDRLFTECISRGIQKENIFVHQFIIDEKFSRKLSNSELTDFCELKNINSNSKTVLLLGGGDGLPRGEKVLDELLMNNNVYQIIIVCGKNKELFSKATILREKFPKLLVFGFVDFVYELLNIADIVITKCGASTIMEILLLQKVPIIVDYIWEQEKGNMEFVRDNNMGIYQKRISELPGIINRLLSDSNYYNFFLQNIKKAKLQTGTSEVAETIKALV
jgi:processive 1,2-diacylglycerol beta-glucosyltransferase/1,2-diacylglycerol 3-beta-galactosyltransferase